MNEQYLTTAGLHGWPLAFTLVGLTVCFVSLFIGWPWEGLIVHYHIEKEENVDSDDDGD
jgi:hypothetical protein